MRNKKCFYTLRRLWTKKEVVGIFTYSDWEMRKSIYRRFQEGCERRRRLWATEILNHRPLAVPIITLHSPPIYFRRPIYCTFRKYILDDQYLALSANIFWFLEYQSLEQGAKILISKLRCNISRRVIAVQYWTDFTLVQSIFHIEMNAP